MFVHYVKTLLFILVLGLGRYACAPSSSDDWHPPVRDDAYFVLQHNDRDCGIAAATTLLRLSGISVGYDRVAAHVTPGNKGVDMRALSGVIARFGISTAGYRVRYARAAAFSPDRPWIALLGAATNGHYVVVRKIVGDTVIVYDPPIGRRTMKRTQFDALWTGYALSVTDHSYRS